MAENIHKNDHSAGLYRAMALRFYSRYVEMRESAHHRGGDLTDHGRLDTEREADQHYLAAVEEWLWETPDSAEAALALVEFAGILAVDRLAGEVMRLPVNDERDAFHQSLALANAGGWLNKIATAEFVERERAVLGGGDVELLALIAEYQRLRDKANQGEMSEEERARRCDDFRSVRDKIEKLRPATLRGVLAVLDLETDEDPGWWPKEAIEGLRDIFTMESQS